MEKDIVPQKYKKHLAMVFLGLKSQEELDEDLMRFNVADANKLILAVKNKIKNSRVPISYLLSLIPRNNFHNLPNFVVNSEEDLAQLSDFLKSYPSTDEIWCFRKEKEGSIGRLAIQSNFGEQLVEQVWSTNHRELEHYNDTSGVPIITANRERWHTPYKINFIKNIDRVQKDRCNLEFIESVKNIERQREKIEDIESFFKSIGIEEFSLEYRFDSRGFGFIDWDTPNDIRVLNSGDIRFLEQFKMN